MEWQAELRKQYNAYSDNGLSPVRCQIIIWTDDDLLFDLLIETLCVSLNFNQ